MDSQETPLFAYWLGVAQSDGHLWSGYVNKKKKPTFAAHLSLETGARSEKMMLTFAQLSRILFGTKATIRTRWRHINEKTYSVRVFIIGLTRQLDQLDGIVFNKIEPPPKFSNIFLFGAYLAGVIDGDGSIKFRHLHKTSRGGAECEVIITSGNEPLLLKEKIADYFLCRPNCKKLKRANAYNLIFYVSKRNNQLIKKYVVPHLQMPIKKERLLWWCARYEERPPIQAQGSARPS